MLYLTMFWPSILMSLFYYVNSEGDLLGCYKDIAEVKKVPFENYFPIKECIAQCHRKYYR